MFSKPCENSGSFAANTLKWSPGEWTEDGQLAPPHRSAPLRHSTPCRALGRDRVVASGKPHQGADGRSHQGQGEPTSETAWRRGLSPGWGVVPAAGELEPRANAGHDNAGLLSKSSPRSGLSAVTTQNKVQALCRLASWGRTVPTRGYYRSRIWHPDHDDTRK